MKWERKKGLIAKSIILKAFEKHGYKKGSRSIKMYLEMKWVLYITGKESKELWGNTI